MNGFIMPLKKTSIFPVDNFLWAFFMPIIATTVGSLLTIVVSKISFFNNYMLRENENINYSTDVQC